jgi:SAM-dependent methyltransferase
MTSTAPSLLPDGVVSHPEWLNINQPPEELASMYGAEDRYWYLRSSEFGEAFLSRIGWIVDKIGVRTLDVGCGEGQLRPHVIGRYTGIDGSETAVATARKRHGHLPATFFSVERFEQYKPSPVNDVIVFGGVLSVLIRPEYRTKFIRHYCKHGMASSPSFPRHFIVYDLEILDTTDIENEFKLVNEQHQTAHIDGIPDVKKHRKIQVYAWP